MYIRQIKKGLQRSASASTLNRNTSSGEKPRGEASVVPMQEVDIEAGLPVQPAAAVTASGIDSETKTATATSAATSATITPGAAPGSAGRRSSASAPAAPPGTADTGGRRLFSGLSAASRVRFRPRAEGESGRSGFHAPHFLRIAFRSSSKVSCTVNILWPVVPAAIACRYALSDTPTNHLISFILAYVAMVPCANLIGFAGSELSRKVPHVVGVLTETLYVA